MRCLSAPRRWSIPQERQCEYSQIMIINTEIIIWIHITVIYPLCISCHSPHRQQPLSGSGNQTLRLCCYDLNYDYFTSEPFKVLLLGHRPAALLPHPTPVWNNENKTYPNSFHSWPASPTDKLATPITYFISAWVKELALSSIHSNFPQAALDMCLQPWSPIWLLS